MSDTLGSLIDKLITVDLKMWNNQEFLYEVRRMTFEEFKDKFTANDQDIRSLFESIKKCCDLNVQRGVLVDEVDEKLIEIISSSQQGEDLDNGKYIQRKHKTY